MPLVGVWLVYNHLLICSIYSWIDIYIYIIIIIYVMYIASWACIRHKSTIYVYKAKEIVGLYIYIDIVGEW